MKKLKIISGAIALFLMVMAFVVAAYVEQTFSKATSNLIALIYSAIMVASIITFAIIHILTEDDL
jgi:hypothetical protein